MLLLGEQLSAAPPDVFDDYFEQDVKVILEMLNLYIFCNRHDITSMKL